jgi:ribosomal protein S12 methylthiotransferase
MRTVALISLGCAKNLVDSEIIVGHLRQAGMTVIPETEKADIVIINTCTFLEASNQESINTILSAHQARAQRKRGTPQKLIVAGCMSQRYPAELPRALPEVDAFIGLDQITGIALIIEKLFANDRAPVENAKLPLGHFEKPVFRVRKASCSPRREMEAPATFEDFSKCVRRARRARPTQ